ncbi:MAG TPA: class I SAM-dependent methyltransferase [bacterium]|nr:class I SAM-dependent methyltransferase [bacterium]
MILVILIIFASVLLLTFAYAGIGGAPYVPTWKKDVDRFLKLAEIKDGEKMYDLGCGDGRLICAAAKAGANVVGLELSLLPYLLSHVRRLFQPEKERIKILYKNFWKTDLRDADIIYFWISKEATYRLQKKFEKELKKGTKIISYVWPIEAWVPVKVDNIEGRSKLYLYKV